MRFLVTIFTFYLLLSPLAVAGNLSFIGPCNETPIIKASLDASYFSTTVGLLTFNFLTNNHIPFAGSPRGFNSIFNTPIGLDALEVLSDSKMRAYGWCYAINGFSPDKYADEVVVTMNDDITWWYGFAFYDSGSWISQCEPAHQIKPDFLCEK